MACTYEELRRDPAALEAVEDGLFEEQGQICAYTGLQIRLTKGAPRSVDFHLEHLIPQEHCIYGQDADYGNLVACWPRPNCGFEPDYGARKKGNWPSPAENHLFVSPLDQSCSSRFSFNRRGEISATRQEDEAAKETIEKLGLAHPALTELRRKAIQGFLSPASRPIKLAEAQRRLQRLEDDAARLDRGETVQLPAFYFAIRQALVREIRKLEGIMAASRKPKS